MHPPPFEVADVIRTLSSADRTVPGLRVSTAQQRVINDLAACHTAKLGGRLDACDACGELRVSYNSCRNRHCPKCQAYRLAWSSPHARSPAAGYLFPCVAHCGSSGSDRRLGRMAVRISGTRNCFSLGGVAQNTTSL